MGINSGFKGLNDRFVVVSHVGTSTP